MLCTVRSLESVGETAVKLNEKKLDCNCLNIWVATTEDEWAWKMWGPERVQLQNTKVAEII